MTLEISIVPFDVSPGQPEFTGDRGLMLDAHTGYTGGAFSSVMPTAFLSLNGVIEFGECRVPIEVFRAWTAAVLEAADRLGAEVATVSA